MNSRNVKLKTTFRTIKYLTKASFKMNVLHKIIQAILNGQFNFHAILADIAILYARRTFH